MLKKHIEEITENGEVFVVETYINDEGVVKGKAKYPKPSEVTPEPVEPEPTDEELYQAEMLLMQTEIIANQNAQDEVLAEILLNQMEV